MADFYGKTGLLCPTVSIIPRDLPPAHPISDIEMLGGQKLSVPAFQVPNVNPYRIANLWRYPASNLNGTILSTGGQIQIPIIRGSGSGHCQRAWLRIQVTNGGGSAVQMQPVPLWIQQLVFQTPAGQTIQNPTGSAQWFNIVSTTPMEEWWELSKAIGADLDYEKGEPVAPGVTVTYYVPLVGSFLTAGGFFLPATSGDIQAYVTFWPDANIRTTGAGPLTVNQISIDIEMEQLPPPILQKTIALFRRNRFDYIIPYFKNQTFIQALTANQLTQLNLSNISGDVVFIDAVIRNNYVGDNLSHYLPLSSFQYQNQEGVGISGQQVIDDQFSRHIMYPKQNEGTFTRNRRFYRYVFANKGHEEDENATYALLVKGKKIGAYPFDNHCTFNFTTAPAGTNEVWNITTSSTAAATAGNILWEWITPDDSTQLSSAVPFSDLASAGPIPLSVTAIQSILNFSGSVTAGGTYAGGNLTITFTGTYANTALQSKGYALGARSSVVATATPVLILPIVSVAGVDGITSGNTYTIDFYATCTGVVSILEDGSMKAYNS